MVIMLAKVMADKGADTFPKLLLLFLIGGAVALLLILEPNMSITICVVLVLVLMIFVGGAKLKHLIAIGLPVLAAGVALIFSEPYRIRRLLAFVDPWASPLDEGYQLIQSYYALGSGGLFGVGIGNSRQKYLFLPFAESDFILAIIGEETGFVGITLFFLTTVVLVYRGVRAAANSEDFFSYLLAFGITLVFGLQVCINALVVSGAIPPTGIPLPLISSGNTALIITMTSMGTLYSVTRKEK
jgi:cell division protein FtsW